MELVKDSNGVYSEASVLYINAVCMQHKCSVGEAIDIIHKEELAHATKSTENKSEEKTA